MPLALAYAADRCFDEWRGPWLEDSCPKRQLDCLQDIWLAKKPRLGQLPEVSLSSAAETEPRDSLRLETSSTEDDTAPKGKVLESVLSFRLPRDCAELLHDAVVGADPPLEWPLPKRRRFLLGQNDPIDAATGSSTFCWGDLRGLSIDMDDGGLHSHPSCCSMELSKDVLPVSSGPLSACRAIVPYRVSTYLSHLALTRASPRLLQSLVIPLRVATIGLHSGCAASFIPEPAWTPRSGGQKKKRVIHWSRDLAIEIYDAKKEAGAQVEFKTTSSAAPQAYFCLDRPDEERVIRWSRDLAHEVHDADAKDAIEHMDMA